MALLPRLYESTNGCIEDLDDCDRYSAESLKQDLSMEELNDIHDWLGIAGSFDNISPLHHQKVLQREILATSSSRLHLIWFNRTIFIKPLPNCLLNAAYFEGIICHNEQAYALASGFLRSYCYLVTSKVDLAIAKDLHLISDCVEWDRWHELRDSVLENIPKHMVNSIISKGSMNKRWVYGELRLARLNWIYQFTLRGVVYFTDHREYGTYFSDFFTTFIIMFAFLTTVLSAMQVIVSTESASPALVTFCFRFAVAALILVAICFCSVSMLFIVMFLYNAMLALVAHWKSKAKARGMKESGTKEMGASRAQTETA